MVYTRLLFNNIKEYTPSFIKTIPYSQVTRPFFGRQRQVQSRMMADPKVKRLLKFIQTNIQKNPFAWQVWIFCNAFLFTFMIYYPWRWAYTYNNKNRSYEVAFQKEKAHKKKLQEQEENQ